MKLKYETSRLFLLLAAAALSQACSQPGKTENKREIQTPPLDFIADKTQGGQLYVEFCSQCHGKNGKGAKQGPPLIHKIYRSDHHSDMSFYKAAQLGTYQHHWHFGNMPPVKNISPEQTGHIIAYIRQEQHKAGIK